MIFFFEYILKSDLDYHLVENVFEKVGNNYKEENPVPFFSVPFIFFPNSDKEGEIVT